MKTITAMPAMLASAALLSACVMADPNNMRSSEADPNANARQSAIVGGVVGALAGAAADDDRRARGAVIGGIAGATAGGIIGNTLDRQEAALRAQLSGNARIVNTGDRLVVTLPQDILFATDSATLTGSLASDLRVLARSMNEFPNSSVQVIGHADNTGAAAYNQDLSQRRALSVARELISGGVAPGRINAIGRGEDQPIASNLTPEGRAQNRRVDIVILPTR